MRNYQFGGNRHVEFDEFKNIERNIKREILDCYDSESPLPCDYNDSENGVSCGENFSSEDDDASVERRQDSAVVSGISNGPHASYNALIDQKGNDNLPLDQNSAGKQVFAAISTEKTIGHEIMDRKRLRVF